MSARGYSVIAKRGECVDLPLGSSVRVEVLPYGGFVYHIEPPSRWALVREIVVDALGFIGLCVIFLSVFLLIAYVESGLL